MKLKLVQCDKCGVFHNHGRNHNKHCKKKGGNLPPSR